MRTATDMDQTSATGTTIRPMTIDDYQGVYDLWLATPGMGLNDRDDSPEGIAAYLARNPTTCFVAEKASDIVGVILCGHDGRRGFIYHLAVRPSARRPGIHHPPRPDLPQQGHCRVGTDRHLNHHHLPTTCGNSRRKTVVGDIM